MTRTLPRAGWIGLAVVVVLVAVMAAFAYLAGNGTVEANLGDKEAGPYNASVYAKEIAKDGPILLPDASPNHSLDIFLQHLGVDPTTGWSAFRARPAGQSDRSCTLVWGGSTFTDPCDGRTFPADGTGLEHFAVRVAGNALYVNFGAAPTATP